MDREALVSILIPTYKSNRSLKNAIDSCLNQTYKNIEIIVVDDNDPNSDYRKITESVMEKFKEMNNVKYIKHEKNKNGAAARNTAFKYSLGKYICFLDDDDIFLKTKVEKQVNYLENNLDFQSVYCWRFQNNKLISSNRTGDLSKELLSLEFTPYTSSIMLRRECFGAIEGFDESYKRHQDYEFLLRFFKLFKIGVVKEPLVKIVGNDVNNMLYGEELEKLKKQFLNQFDNYINHINETQNGFKKLVYSRHYSAVFWSYFKRRKFIDSTRIFIVYSFRCGFDFWKSIYRQLNNYVRIKIGNFD